MLISGKKEFEQEKAFKVVSLYSGLIWLWCLMAVETHLKIPYPLCHNFSQTNEKTFWISREINFVSRKFKNLKIKLNSIWITNLLGTDWVTFSVYFEKETVKFKKPQKL